MSNREQLSSVLPPLAKFTAVVAVLFAGAGITFSFFSFRARNYALGINFHDLVEWTNEPPPDTKEFFLPTLIEAIQVNDKKLAKKQIPCQICDLVYFLNLTFLSLYVNQSRANPFLTKLE
ncbi:hypothetical protein MYX82_04305 [Acidobacteria bacterium AH-259-D05]|nr:hypothetical protein [Acidobacteria bacterium AH-259-D05]